MKKISFIGWLSGIAAEGGWAWAGTCSLCREVLDQGGSQRLVKGYYWSILLLVGLPLLILMVGARYAWRRYNS